MSKTSYKHYENKEFKKSKKNNKKNKRDPNKPLTKRQEFYKKIKEKERGKESEKIVPICKYFISGACKIDGCTYSHDVLPHQMNKFKEMCKYYPMGECTKGDMCCFMHEKFPCQFFHNKIGSKCNKGSECIFSHEPLTEEMAEILEKHLNIQAGRGKIVEVTTTRTNETFQSNFGKSSLAPEVLHSVNIENFTQNLFTSSNLINTYEYAPDEMTDDDNDDINENDNNEPEKEINQTDKEKINLEVTKEIIQLNMGNTEMAPLSSFSNIFSRNILSINEDPDNIDSLENDSSFNIDQKNVSNSQKRSEPINILESLASNMNNIPTFTKMVDDSDSDCDLSVGEYDDSNNRNFSRISEYTKINDKIDEVMNKSVDCFPDRRSSNVYSDDEIENDNKFDLSNDQIDLPTMNTIKISPLIFNEQHRNLNNFSNEKSEYFSQNKNSDNHGVVTEKEKVTNTLTINDLNKSRIIEPIVDNRLFNDLCSNEENIDKITENPHSVDNNNNQKLLGKRIHGNTEKVKCKKKKKNDFELTNLSRLSTDLDSHKEIVSNKISTLSKNDEKIKKSIKNESITKKIHSKKKLKSKPKLTPSIINSDSNSDINTNNLECINNEVQIDYSVNKDIELNPTNQDKNYPVTDLSEIDDVDNIDWLSTSINANIHMISSVFTISDDEDDSNMNNIGKIKNESKCQQEIYNIKNELNEITDLTGLKNSLQDIPINVNNQENQCSFPISPKSAWSPPILNLSPQNKYHEMNINCFNLHHKFDDPRIRNHPKALKQSVYDWLVS